MLTKTELAELETPYISIGKKIDLLLMTGQLLMENGANTDRIVRDILRSGTYMGIPQDNINLHISYGTIMLNVNDGEHFHTGFKKALKHNVDMSIISAISKLAWRAMAEEYPLQQYESELYRISKGTQKYSVPTKMISAGLACAAFSILFGSNIYDAFFTMVSAMIGFYIRLLGIRWEVNIYVSIITAAFIATLTSYGTSLLSPSNTPWFATISCTLFMIPGIPLMNAIDDFLNNYIVSGLTRATHTILIVSSMAAGIFGALSLTGMTSLSTIDITPHSLTGLQVLAAFIGATGFSVLFNTPVRLLPIIGIGGIIAVALRNIVLLHTNVGLVIASFFGVVLIGLITLRIATPCKTAPNVLGIPSIIPLIPGVLLYRFLIAILSINEMSSSEFLKALQLGTTGVFVVIGLAVGLSTPQLLTKKYLDRGKLKNVSDLLLKRHNHIQ